jgi:hypothetical protein
MTRNPAPRGQAEDRVEFVDTWRGIPLTPRQRTLILPAAPPRAVRNALGLVDSHTPFRSFLVSCARSFSRSRLIPLLPIRRRPADAARQELGLLIRRVSGELPGTPAVMAVAMREERIDALLMDAVGVPLAFVKLATGADAAERMEMEAGVLACLREPADPLVRVPRMLAAGSLGDWPYHTYEPIPDGAHRRPEPDAELVRAVGREVRERLAALPRPADIPSHHVPGHGDFTHRNLRAAADGSLWLLDWEYARWMPVLADELRYWTTHYAFGFRLDPQGAARRIVAVLRGRGTDDDIAEAVAFPEFNRPREQAIRGAVGALVGMR